MGREAFLSVLLLSCLTLNNTSARVLNIATNTGILDNVGTASVSRLYRNVPLGVYASNAPYAAFSFQVPNFIAPKPNQIPIKEESVVIQNSNGFLRDSYGNKYHETPQSLAYKTTFPQQYVQLQNLPAHLSQPLGIGPNFQSPNLQFKQVTPHFFGPAQYTLSNVQGFSTNPVRYTISQPIIYGSNVGNIAPQSQQLSQAPKQATAQQQPSINKDVYVETNPSDKPSEAKAQRVEELSTPSYTTAINEHTTKQNQQSSQTKKVPKRQPLAKETSITTHVNGKKTVVNIRTKPPLPLLDISLLEPLTFDNPLVPQVQHFLPRIHDATYHKLGDVNEVKKHQMEFVVQNTKSYDTDAPKGKSKNETHKRKHKKTRLRSEDDDEEVQPTPTIKVKGTPNDGPEFSYEINSPNYKETYSEQKVSYNKETDSEPVQINYEKKTENEPITYTYEKHTESKPIHYTYVHDSSKPEQIKETYYHSNDEEPKQLIYHFNSNQGTHKNKEERHSAPHSEREQSSYKDTSDDDDDESERGHGGGANENHNDNQVHHNHDSRSNNHPKPEHREKSYSRPNHENGENHGKFGYNVRLNTPHKHAEKHFQPIIPEYEEDITILPTHKPHSNFHEDEHENNHEKHNNKHHSHSTKSYKPHFQNTKLQYASAPTTHEKSKRIIIKEESPADTDQNHEKLMGVMIKQQEENEENFEKAYKDAAYGFPAYDRPIDVEKDIYNPESYGASKYHSEFDVENTPLLQYQAEGDDFPQDSRFNYKDSKDKMKEEYFLDYAISRPTSVLDRFKNKENYYKMFEKHKPQRYYVKPDGKKKSAYTVDASYGFLTPNNKETNAKLKVSPYLYEYDYTKEAPREDNSAYATQPYQRYKSKTQFVEPQYQYGFEPVSIPRLLDSELAAMASNDNIESENPGTRKKIYKENFYIKKTTTAKGR